MFLTTDTAGISCAAAAYLFCSRLTSSKVGVPRTPSTIFTHWLRFACLRLCAISVSIGRLAKPTGTTLGRRGLPEQRRAVLRRTGIELQASSGYLECRFLL